MPSIDEDKLTRDCKLLQDQFTQAEKRLYHAFRRELLKEFNNPNYAILMMINVASGEYIRYIRSLDLEEEDAQSYSAACVKSILNALNDLKLTPSSQESSNVSNTLSQLMNSIVNKQPTK